MRDGKWVRWLGVGAALAALAFLIFSRRFPVFVFGGTPSGPGHLGYIALCIFPAYAAVFLCGFSRFWWALPIGLLLFLFSTIFYIDRSSAPTSLLFVLAAATICTTPFLDRACRPTGPGTNEDAKPEDEPLDKPPLGGAKQ